MYTASESMSEKNSSLRLLNTINFCWQFLFFWQPKDVNLALRNLSWLNHEETKVTLIELS